MTTIYKLTDEYNQTKHETQWGINVSHEVTGTGDLCSAGWLHAYTNPLLALLLNPIHASFVNPHLWLAEGSGSTKSDRGMKVGYSKITTIEQMELPVITDAQHVAFGILCALEVCHDSDFVQWANAWLDGSDRSADGARAAYAVAWHWDAQHAKHARDAAVRAAVDAAYSDAYAAVYDVAVAADVADGYDAALDLDLVALAERAMTY